MKSHPFDRLPLPNGGTFIFTPCPGTQSESLNESLSTLKNAGASAVITMLSDEELAYLNVPLLGEGVTTQGMGWFQLPVVDDCAPEAAFFRAYAQHKTALLSLVNQASTLVIHCRSGTGRTGLMAAMLLLDSGMAWKDVKPLIQSVRPKALTLEPHLDFLQQRYGISD